MNISSSNLPSKKEKKSVYDRTPLVEGEAPAKSALIDEERSSYGSLHAPLTNPTPNPIDNDAKNYADEEDSYTALLRRNRELRLYICSLLVTNCGEWLTYIASIDLIETKLASLDQESRTAISILVLVRLLPNVFFSSLGGMLADKYDRRKLMVGLDAASAMAGLLFVLAYELQSITIVYVATIVQQILCGLYQPSSYSIIPMLVHNDDKDLKKATTMQGLVWSAMQALGAALSGIVVDALGIRTCFRRYNSIGNAIATRQYSHISLLPVLDAATFLLSSVLIWMVRGDYRAAPEEKRNAEIQLTSDHGTSYIEGVKYLFSSYFAALIFLKGFGGLAYGACDILNVVLSEQSNGTVADDLSSDLKLGAMFAFVGMGCLIGPLVTEPFVDAERPATLQLSCVLSFAAATIGYVGWSWKSTSFWFLCGFAMIRAAGASIIWINSSILLQKFAAAEMMGRVMSMDYAIALSTEALSAYLCGYLMDRYGLSFHQVAFGLTIISLVSTIFWSVYHFSGRGAMKYMVARQ